MDDCGYSRGAVVVVSETFRRLGGGVNDMDDVNVDAADDATVAVDDSRRNLLLLLAAAADDDEAADNDGP